MNSETVIKLGNPFPEECTIVSDFPSLNNIVLHPLTGLEASVDVPGDMKVFFHPFKLRGKSKLYVGMVNIDF